MVCGKVGELWVDGTRPKLTIEVFLASDLHVMPKSHCPPCETTRWRHLACKSHDTWDSATIDARARATQLADGGHGARALWIKDKKHHCCSSLTVTKSGETNASIRDPHPPSQQSKQSPSSSAYAHSAIVYCSNPTKKHQGKGGRDYGCSGR